MLSYDNQFAGTVWYLKRKTDSLTVSVVRVHMRAKRAKISPSFRNTETWKVLKSEGNKSLITMMLLQLLKWMHRPTGQELSTLQWNGEGIRDCHKTDLLWSRLILIVSRGKLSECLRNSPNGNTSRVFE